MPSWTSSSRSTWAAPRYRRRARRCAGGMPRRPRSGPCPSPDLAASTRALSGSPRAAARSSGCGPTRRRSRPADSGRPARSRSARRPRSRPPRERGSRKGRAGGRRPRVMASCGASIVGGATAVPVFRRFATVRVPPPFSVAETASAEIVRVRVCGPRRRTREYPHAAKVQPRRCIIVQVAVVAAVDRACRPKRAWLYGDRRSRFAYRETYWMKAVVAAGADLFELAECVLGDRWPSAPGRREEVLPRLGGRAVLSELQARVVSEELAALVAGTDNEGLPDARRRATSARHSLIAQQLLRTSGGRAGNAAVMACRLGRPARLFGCVGDDDLAEQAIRGPEGGRGRSRQRAPRPGGDRLSRDHRRQWREDNGHGARRERRLFGGRRRAARDGVAGGAGPIGARRRHGDLPGYARARHSRRHARAAGRPSSTRRARVA